MTLEFPRPDPSKIPPSGLGPDGKLRRLTHEEHKCLIESASQRLAEIAEMTEEDPPGAFEEVMRSIDESRPHRPLFRGMYGAMAIPTPWMPIRSWRRAPSRSLSPAIL